MKLANHIVSGILVVLASSIASASACAETKLTDFNGNWQGHGNDRYTPFESMQRTSCQATINANLTRMSAKIVCNGDAGLTKIVQMTISLAGDAFSGNLTQTATTRGNGASVSVLNGSVSGHKTDNTANFKVSFPGLTPSVEVTLKLNSPSSFSMQAATLGGALTDVTYNRTAKP